MGQISPSISRPSNSLGGASLYLTITKVAHQALLVCGVSKHTIFFLQHCIPASSLRPHHPRPCHEAVNPTPSNDSFPPSPASACPAAPFQTLIPPYPSLAKRCSPPPLSLPPPPCQPPSQPHRQKQTHSAPRVLSSTIRHSLTAHTARARVWGGGAVESESTMWIS